MPRGQFNRTERKAATRAELLKLADPQAIPVPLLDVVCSILVRALESSPEARAQLASCAIISP